MPGAAGATGATGRAGTNGATGAGLAVHYIGESYQGGIVYWVQSDGQHGLMAATADQGRVQWYNGTTFKTNATADGIYGGAKNTQDIIVSQTSVGLICAAEVVPDNCTGGAATATSDYAALLAATDGDWYLPSKDELNLLYNFHTANPELGGFDTTIPYWSSSEYLIDRAWSQSFSNGAQSLPVKSDHLLVRAVRAF